MKNVTKVVYAILTVVFKVPALETIHLVEHHWC
jgi:hypothetical protein